MMCFFFEHPLAKNIIWFISGISMLINNKQAEFIHQFADLMLIFQYQNFYHTVKKLENSVD
ncbi:hypothetical protein AY606_14580 [Acinetobacter sp. SFB]|nr:hypothetical protein AY606_14580 [Acinetobacter sp. SFB]